MKAQLLIDPGVKLGEGPIWHNEHRVLTWVDILGKSFHIFNSETGEDQAVSTPQMVSFAAYLGKVGKEKLLIALEDGLYIYRENKFSLIKKLPGYNGKIRFNDGAFDRRGRLYIGTMGLEDDDDLNRCAGSLYCYDKGNLTTLLNEVTISNGIAFDYLRKRFYFNDTQTQQVALFDYDEDTGGIFNRREFVSLLKEQGFPDGMTIDSDGNIYVALWQGGGIRIYNPQGEFIGFIEVDVDNVTSVEFGDLSVPFVPSGSKSEKKVSTQPVLYITTAQNQKGEGGGLYFIYVKDLIF